MKCLFFFTFLSLGFSTMAQTENDKRVELGKQVFKALQTNDPKLYRDLYPTFEEYKLLIQEMADAHIDGLTQQQADDYLVEYKLKADSTYNAEFLGLRQQADSIGIDWQRATFISFESIAAFPENISVKYIDGYLKFKAGETSYMMDVEAFEFSPDCKLQAVKDIREYK